MKTQHFVRLLQILPVALQPLGLFRRILSMPHGDNSAVFSLRLFAYLVSLSFWLFLFFFFFQVKFNQICSPKNYGHANTCTYLFILHGRWPHAH